MVVTQVGAIDAAVRSCEEVLLSQPENIKALYRLGKVLTAVKTADLLLHSGTRGRSVVRMPDS